MPNVVPTIPTVQAAPLTNRAFLEGVFGPLRWGDAHVTSFWGDPGAPTAHWAGRRARRHKHIEDGSQNQYFTVSQFWDAVDGNATRKESYFRAMFCLVVDDVGPKVDRALVQAKFPPPTWRLETSPGNEQWGWVLEMPELDLGRARAMADMLVKHGLTPNQKDPGMRGVGRYVRMPVGTNGKPDYGGNFGCVLLEWAPERRYTPDELMAGWGLVLPAPGSVVPGARTAVRVDPAQATADPCLGAMVDLGWVREELSSGWGYDCTCPCADEHTPGRDSGCAYRPGPTGAWVCHHGHCQTAVLDKAGHTGMRPWWQFYAGLERGLAAAGLEPMRRREFAVVDDDDPEVLRQAARVADFVAGVGVGGGGPRAKGVSEEFLSEHVFSKPDNMFYSLSRRVMIPRQSLNSVYGPILGRALAYDTPKGEVKYLPVDKWFFAQRGHRVIDGFTYWPGRGAVFEHESRMLANRYRPVSLPDPGRRVATAEIRPWLDLVKHVLGAEGGRAVVRFLDWCGAVLAEPELKPGWLIVVQGGQGLGKDLLVLPMLRGVGAQNHIEINADMLASEFTGYAERRLVVVKELKQTTRGAASGHDQYNRLKWLVDTSAQSLSINPKYGRPYEARNVAAVIVTTNERDAVALAPDDRRALVFVFPEDGVAWTKAQFQHLHGWLDRWDGWELVVAWLVQRWARLGQTRRDDLSSNAPRTAGRQEMIDAAAGPVLEWVTRQIEADPSPDWPNVVTAAQVVANVSRAIVNPASGLPRHVRAPTEDQAGKMLSRLGAVRLGKGEAVRTKRLGRARLWAIRVPHAYATLGHGALAKLIDEEKINDFVGPQVVVAEFGGAHEGVGQASEATSEASPKAPDSSSSEG